MMDEMDEELMDILANSMTIYMSDLRDSTDNQDLDKIRNINNKIKGSGSSFGYMDISEKAWSIHQYIDCNHDNVDYGYINSEVETLINMIETEFM